MFASWNPAQPEITDLIVRHDPHSLERLLVRKQDVLNVFAKFHNRQAMRAVEELRAQDDVLDAREIDRLLVSIHWEMQRLGEEFYHGPRVHAAVSATITTIRAAGHSGPLRVVDIGCGIGYTLRWLAGRTQIVSQGVELLGVDLNSALIQEANRLSRSENLPCHFVHGDAFSPDHSGQIYLSTGVIHHFRGPALSEFLSRHQRPETLAFLHFDFQPSLLAPYGSWFFHILRMRTRVARHDGVLSAARAHTAETLVQAARSGAPEFASGMYGVNIWNTPVPRVFHTLIGVRRTLLPHLKTHFGPLASRLGELK